MSKMSNIDLTIKEIREWIERILILITIVVLIGIIYISDYSNTSRINNIERTLRNHTHYIDQLEADVDNLYRVVE